MAGDTEDVTFKLSADTKEFVEKILSAKGSLQSLGDAKNLTGMVEGLTRVGLGVGAVGAALYAVKAAVDLVFDAEQIKQVNVQFENLTQNAGIATSTLKSGLEGAARGLIDDTDLLRAANKALVEMGDRAAKLPEIMELARKATNVYGGETVDNFEAINRAIATGSTRQLRNLGLQIDAQKAYKDYAKSIGTVAEALTEAGKQEAIMQAVLEKGQTRFKGVDGSVKEATNAWKEFKVAINDIAEAFIIAFDKIIGPTVKKVFHEMAESAKRFKEGVKEVFGEPIDEAGKNVNFLKTQIEDLQKKIAQSPDHPFAGEWKKDLDSLNVSLVVAQSNMKGILEGEKESRVDPIKELDARMKIEKSIIELKKSGLQAARENAQSEADVVTNLSNELDLIIREAELKKYNVRKAYRDGQLTDEKEMNLMLQGIEQDRINEQLVLIKKLEDARQKAEENYIRASRDTWDATARAAEVAGAREIRANKNVEEQGKKNYDSLKRHSIDAFLAMGAGQKSAAEAMKGFLFNVIADRAQAEGQVLLLSSLWPPNPLGIAAGGGLIALAGFLRSQAGGGGGDASAPATGGVASGGFGTRTDEKPTLSQQAAQKSVSIVVQGSYFETEQTKTALVDLIRQNQDATDFKVTSIGGGI